MSAFDPKRTSCHGGKPRICLGLSIVVNRLGGDMQRRGGSGQPVKGQRKRTKSEARKVPTARASIAEQDELLDQRTRERDEALEQLAATSEVLKVISHSTFDLQTIFDTLVKSAARLCRADKANIALLRGDSIHYVADHGFPPDFMQYMHSLRLTVQRGSISGRAVLEGKIVHIPDVLADPEFALPESAKLGSFRTALGVPLLREGTPIGTMFLARVTVDPFSQQQIALLQTFADQAVIAIENARLLNELRQRTDDLTESLEQQTATSEVLKVISSSPGEVHAVFNSILDNAVRICGARFANLVLYDRVNLRVVAMHNAPPEFEKIRKANPIVPLQGSAVATLVQTKQRVHILDLAALPAFASSPLITAARARSMLAVPMLKDDELIGGINIYRQEVKPFTDKQIALLENFAAQAVIAIENARLLNELRESLQQQTATADVLKVISRSTFDLQTVFKALVDSAAQLCRAKMANIALLKEDGFEYYAAYGFEPDYMAYVRSHNLKADRGSVIGRAALEARVVHIHDVLADPEYATGPGNRWRLDAQ